MHIKSVVYVKTFKWYKKLASIILLKRWKDERIFIYWWFLAIKDKKVKDFVSFPTLFYFLKYFLSFDWNWICCLRVLYLIDSYVRQEDLSQLCFVSFWIRSMLNRLKAKMLPSLSFLMVSEHDYYGNKKVIKSLKLKLVQTSRDEIKIASNLDNRIPLCCWFYYNDIGFVFR